jgi:hypothetical protein
MPVEKALTWIEKTAQRRPFNLQGAVDAMLAIILEPFFSANNKVSPTNGR